MVHIYNGILAIKKNKFESVLVRWIKLEPVIQNEVSLKEKNKYIDTYMESKKLYWWTYLQRRNGDTDVENQLVDTVGEGMGRMEKVSSTCIHYQM